MYQPRPFVETDSLQIDALVSGNPLATVIRVVDGMPEADPVPLLWDRSSADRGMLRGHVARANPLWKDALEKPVPVLVVFHGPQCYVSPSWYAGKREHGKVVPTWNYQVVQMQGVMRAIDNADWIRRLVSALSDAHEQARPQPWRVSDAPDDYLEAMYKAIVGIDICVTAIHAKSKVGQNRTPADQQSLLQGLEEAGENALAQRLRQHMVAAGSAPA